MGIPPSSAVPDHRVSWRFAATLVATAAVVALLPMVDRWAWQHVRMDGVYNRDWGRLLRVAGFAPAWILGAVAIMLSRSGHAATTGWRKALMPGWFLLGSIAVTGLIGELVKPAVPMALRSSMLNVALVAAET